MLKDISSSPLIEKMLYSVLVISLIIGVAVSDQRVRFKGAVSEHRVILPEDRGEIYSRQEAVEAMMANLRLYNQQAMTAARQSMEIIVFPESGLYGWNFDRYNITPFLEYVPNLADRRWNPCTNRDLYPESRIQYELSCIARNNSMFIVANMGSMVKCHRDDDNDDDNDDEDDEVYEQEHDEYCPDSGHYQYNTQVVFDQNGYLIATYRKHNLLMEPYFDYPRESQRVTFQTPFGKFGLIMCSDLDQYDPTIQLIEEMKVANLVCSGSSRDLSPINIAVQRQYGFARGYGINLLASGIHDPSTNRHGSGIYTPDGRAQFAYDDREGTEGQIIMRQLSVLKRPYSHITPRFDPEMMNEAQTDTYQAYVNNDVYTFYALKEPRAAVRLCASDLCCNLDYILSVRGGDEYSFGVFSGFREINQYQRYYQACILMRCVNASEGQCGVPKHRSQSYFTQLRIGAYFSTNYTYPLFLVNNRGQLDIGTQRWKYQNGVLWSDQTVFPVESAGFYGRIFDRDTVKSAGTTVALSLVLMLSSLSTFIFQKL